MKKFIALFLSLLILFSLSACGGTTINEDGSVSGKDWQEVQSITYCLKDGDEITLTSTYEWEVSDINSITAKEFNAAPEELKDPFYDTRNDISVDKSNLPENPNQYFNKICYFSNFQIVGNYVKFTISGFSIRYVKVHTISDNKLEINHYKDNQFVTETIVPISYRITHFSK